MKVTLLGGLTLASSIYIWTPVLLNMEKQINLEVRLFEALIHATS